MLFTTIHRALGLEPETLSAEIIRATIEAGVKEEKSLDWKACLPMKGTNSNWKMEFVKDVAAMANSGGGIILFGIQEDGNSGAKKKVPTELTDKDKTGLLSLVYKDISPPVLGVDFRTLTDSSGPVIVMSVPDSTGSPHLVHPASAKDYFAAPIRYGAKTEFMTGENLSNAYRIRYEGEAKRKELLREKLNDTASDVEEVNPVTFVAFAMPSNPSSGVISKKVFPRIIGSAQKIREEILGLCCDQNRIPHDQDQPLDRLSGHETELGYRSIFEYRGPSIYPWHSSIKLNFDGSIAFTAAIGNRDIIGEPFNPIRLERFSVDFVSFVLAASAEIGVSGSYEIGLTLKEGTSNGRVNEHMTSISPFPMPIKMQFFNEVTGGEEPITLKSIHPAFSRLWTGASKEDGFESAQALFLDILNQGNTDRTQFLYR